MAGHQQGDDRTKIIGTRQRIACDHGRLELLALSRGHTGCHSSCYGRDAAQRRLHVTEFDSVPADLDTVVDAAHKLQRPVGLVSSEVAGAIPGRAVVLDESLGGEIAVAAVSAGDASAADPQFPRYPIRAVAAVRVDDPARVVGQRHAIRHGRPVLGHLGNLADGAVDGGLGGAAQSSDAQSGRGNTEAMNQRGQHPIATGRHHAQRGQLSGPSDIDEHLEPSGQEVEHRDPLGFNQARPLIGVAAVRFVDDNDGTAGGERSEDVEDRHVALQRGQCEATVVRADAEVVVEGFDGVHRRSVRNFNALGFPGRSRREQDVGQRL